MIDIRKIQEEFMKEVTEVLPDHLSTVEAVAQTLDISNDRAYRRIRGEKELSFSDLLKLADTFHISIDKYIKQDTPKVSFDYRSIFNQLSLTEYLKSIVENLEMLKAFPGDDKLLIYVSKDLPFFRFFDFPHLSRFKMFFWLKTILQKSEYSKIDYNPEMVPTDMFNAGRAVSEAYDQVPSLELWNWETLDSTLNQIGFFYDCGFFTNRKYLEDIVNDVNLILDKTMEAAENGSKLGVGGPENYKLYYNEVTLGDNSILFRMGKRQVTFITHNVLNILTTTNPTFCKESNEVVDNIIKKSTLLSNASAKDRIRYFNILQKKVDVFRARVLG